MRTLATVLLVLCVFTTVNGQLALQASRSLVTDLDGDGRLEVIEGGRLGAFRSDRTVLGGIVVGHLEGERVTLPISEEIGSVIRDLDVGRFASDKSPHVFTVGDGHLGVYRYTGGSLGQVHTQVLASTWTDRVATLDSRDGAIVAVTEYEIMADRDVGRTTIRAFLSVRHRLVEIWAVEISAHVGDLTFVKDDGAYRLVVETGTAEEGGDVLVYQGKGTNKPAQVWGGRIMCGLRCLSISTSDHQMNRIVVRAIDGSASEFTVAPSLQRGRRLQIPVEAELIPVWSRTHPQLPKGGILYRHPSNDLLRPLTF